ncbi:MAG: hypothetical protein ACI4UU_05065 [Clostridia bacterium]
MPIINFTNPISILVAVILFVLVLYLAKETKKAWITGALLFVFIGVLVAHTIEFVTIGSQSQEIYNAIVTSATMDLIFVFLSFISYLWIDDIQAKEGKRKSIDNSLDWFWNKV